jgi:hypothetical protein
MSESEPSRRMQLGIYAYTIVAGIVLLVAGLVITCQQKQLADDTGKRHAARLKADATPPAADGQPGPIAVHTGFYVDRISNMSFQDTSWTLDFYVWFRWRGAVEPGKTFQVVDGEIEDDKQITRTDDGDLHYELHKVKATITKVFTIERFPNDDHALTLAIEDGELGTDQIAYVADVENTSISSRVKVPGYAVTDAKQVVKDHAYKTTRGDPRLEGKAKAVHSQSLYVISIGRPDWNLFLKLFITMYVAVAVALLVFFLAPNNGERFGLSVGALFAVVANAYVIQGSLPTAGGLVMADLVSGLATFTILLSVLQSAVSAALNDRGWTALAVRSDRLMFASLSIAFVIVNVTIPLAAMR